MDLMASMLDGHKSLRDRNTTAAETVELDTSREDVRMLLKRSINRLGEGTLESESTIHFFFALELVGLASSIITAHTRTMVLRASDNAGSIARTRFIAHLTDTHVEVLVGKRLADDVADHLINAEADLALSLESIIAFLSVLSLVLVLGKSVRNKVLRNSGLILLSDEGGLLGTNKGVLHETSEGKVLEAEITILARRGGRLLGSIVVRILKDGGEISIHAMSVNGADPTMRPARSDVGLELGIFKASIRRSRGRSRSGNIDVLREVLLVEHGARIAGRHEEDKSLEHLLGGHSIKNLGEISIVEELISGHSNDTRVTVIIVENENVIVLSGFEDLATATTSRITRKSTDKVLNTSVLSDIILYDTSINIDVGTTLNIDFVIDLAGEGVARVVSNIILEESDDTLIRDTSRVSKLISLAHRGLVTIVGPASATSNEDNPGLTTLSLASLNGLTEKLVLLVGECNGNQSKCYKNSLHVNSFLL